MGASSDPPVGASLDVHTTALAVEKLGEIAPAPQPTTSGADPSKDAITTADASSELAKPKPVVPSLKTTDDSPAVAPTETMPSNAVPNATTEGQGSGTARSSTVLDDDSCNPVDGQGTGSTNN